MTLNMQQLVRSAFGQHVHSSAKLEHSKRVTNSEDSSRSFSALLVNSALEAQASAYTTYITYHLARGPRGQRLF